MQLNFLFFKQDESLRKWR